MEKPEAQDPFLQRYLVNPGTMYLVDGDRIVPSKTTQGLDQVNRLLVVKETSHGAGGWSSWPASNH